MQRILVIEDNPANMELMVYLLEAFGYEALPAADGRQGLARARSELPALVVCDVHLPHLDGYGVVRAFRDDPQLRGIPVIAVTALAMSGDREKLLAAGFDGYLSKPIDPEAFVPSLREFLSRRPPPAFVQPPERRQDGDHTDR
ncbi:response regulator [Noviherbaspirillum aridicola]|uniref:Response regulator n=1 Tax=Noviherbaspirillum aridicola TaxID=2849687 RepID=A0ABQ4Q6I9_9BURK|nr:response regulator [Noviherbaspirillum aridicola]GIZ52420.1 response regulator [Noviherbaspirillum aridicola]